MDFVTDLPLSVDWKGNNSYDWILVIIDQLTIMVHYKPVKVTINAPRLAKVIINIVIQYHGLLDSIISDQGAIFISKFWSLLCHFLGIKQRLSTKFHSWTDKQMEWQNSIMEAYLYTFMNWKQNNWARLLSMVKFAYNNSKNVNTGHVPFELNCGYYPYVFFKDECDTCSRSFLAKGLAMELRKLMNVYCQNLLHV